MTRRFILHLPLLTAALVCLTASLAHGDTIALYADSMRTDCNLNVPPGTYMTTHYLFHHSAAGASGSRFRLPRPNCLAGNIIGPFLMESAFPVTGSVATGFDFQYGACLTGSIYLSRVVYIDTQGLGGWFPCCEQMILAHTAAASGEVEAFDCEGSPRAATGVSARFRGDATCPCDVVTGVFDDPLAPTTWGRVKALYDN